MEFSELPKHVFFVTILSGMSFSSLLYKDTSGAARRVAFNCVAKKLYLLELLESKSLEKEARVQLVDIAGVKRVPEA